MARHGFAYPTFQSASAAAQELAPIIAAGKFFEDQQLSFFCLYTVGGYVRKLRWGEPGEVQTHEEQPELSAEAFDAFYELEKLRPKQADEIVAERAIDWIKLAMWLWNLIRQLDP